MDQPEEILEKLERFNVQKNPEIPRELDEYVSFVARTGDSVFAWPLVKNLYREKLINVITEFYNEQSTKELPSYPNVDPFNYDTMKKVLIEKLDSFHAAPFTIQRISELLADPRKQYSRIDKFMRAVEKNILVVSTVAPGRHRSEESENGDSLDSALNGEFSSDVNVDIVMDDRSFTITKEFNVTTHRKEENHDIDTTNHEVITIKKTASSEEEAGTSAIAIDPKTGEPPQGTQTDISIESESTVTITVCEPSSESKPDNLPVSTESEENSSNKSASESNEESAAAQEPEAKSEAAPQESVITEIIEPKIDDALLNEPLRPNDEILVDTSDISATTPLAALENIVAIRTDPSIIEAVETPLLESSSPQISPEEDTADNSENSKSSSDDCDSESGIEAKRLKIEEFEEEKAEEKVPVEKVLEESQEKPAASENPEKVEVEAVQEVPQKEETAQPEPIAVSTIAEEEKPEISPPVETAAPIVEEPIVAEAIEEETPAETMETTVPIVENTMATDEDEPAVPEPEIEMAPVAAAAAVANKMDTDENEETALMDVDDEPMDQ